MTASAYCECRAEATAPRGSLALLKDGGRLARRTVFTPHGQRIHHFGGEDGDDRRFEESVAGGERKNVVAQAQGQGGRQDHDVEVTGVIGHHDERSRVRQVFAAGDFDALGKFEDAVDPPPPEIAGNEAHQAAFTPHGFASCFGVETEIVSGLIVPIVHD